jgi:hypothetical protein
LYFEAYQGPVGCRDRALGIAQGVTDLDTGRFLALEVAGKRFDPCAQGPEILLFRGRKRSGCPQAERNQKDGSPQGVAFP